jgi:energy-coupling factor transport system permease protein
MYIEYVDKNTIFHRISPLTKLIFLGALWATSLLMMDIIGLVCVIAVIMVVWYVAKIEYKRMIGIVAISTSMVLLFLFFQTFFYSAGLLPEEIVILFTIPYINLSARLQGLMFGTLVGMKIYSVVLALPVLIMTTPISGLLAVLQKYRFPYKFNLIMGMAFRFTPLTTLVYRNIMDAQKLRGFDVDNMSWIDKMRRAYIPIIIPMMMLLLRQSEQIDITLASRGFGADVKRTSVQDINMYGIDYAVAAIGIAICVVLMLYFGIAPPIAIAHF